MRYILPFLLFSSSLFAAQGNIVHSFKEGKIQFLSEKTPDGRVVGLIKPLKSNTRIESVKIDTHKETISFLMLVEEDNPICAGWTDAQPLTIKLDPKSVAEISLQGKNAASAGKITILSPSDGA